MSSLAHRTRTRVRAKPLGRPVKKHSHPNLTPSKPAQTGSEVDISALIPIRGMETPRPSPSVNRLATSAPAQFMSSPSGFGALARMSAGGFKPNKVAKAPAAKTSGSTSVATSSITAGRPDTDRTRKERSGSTTSPGPNLLQAGMDSAQGAGAVKGKRAKV
jgi:hypothetical protein